MSTDLAALTAESFDPHRGTAFALTAQGGALVLDAVRRGPAPAGFRASFSLIFTGEKSALLSQGIHALVHPALGTLDLFLVPVQPSPTHARYEAVFG